LEAPNSDTTSYSEFQDFFSFPESLLVTAASPPTAEMLPRLAAGYVHAPAATPPTAETLSRLAAGFEHADTADETTAYIDMKVIGMVPETGFEKEEVLLSGRQVRNSQASSHMELHCWTFNQHYLTFMLMSDE
jgi:hypothetical protein